MNNTDPGKVRIAFLIRSLYYGGAERQLLTLVKRMDKKRFEPVVITYYPGGDLDADFMNSGINVITLDKKDRWVILPFFFRLVKIIREFKPDLIHSYLTMSNVLAVPASWLAGRLPVVFGIRYSYMNLSKYDRLTRFVYWLESRISPLATMTIVNSNAGKKNLIELGFSPKLIQVIPNGIDVQTYYPSPSERAEFRQRLGIPDDQLLVGMVGRLDPIKDHPSFLQAAELLLRVRNNVQFIIVGDGDQEYLNQLLTLAHSLKIDEKVLWLEGQKNVRAVYNGLDIFCSASIGESFSNVIAEAMSCGKPCVVTEAGDSAMIVAENGIVVPVGDVEELAKGLSRFLDMSESDRHTIGENSRKRIEENFSVDRMVRRTEQVLINLAKGIPIE